nr:MAG TPA: hypothetical protein [Caudoviricetes sp.]DAQ06616.1 MAG TPA: hypothetical protein [Caudoviricetes sp.]
MGMNGLNTSSLLKKLHTLKGLHHNWSHNTI